MGQFQHTNKQTNTLPIMSRFKESSIMKCPFFCSLKIPLRKRKSPFLPPEKKYKINTTLKEKPGLFFRYKQKSSPMIKKDPSMESKSQSSFENKKKIKPNLFENTRRGHV